jgi:hypothetical protein
VGLTTFNDVNHGFNIWGDCDYIDISGGHFYRTGTLHVAGDKAGDGIYFSGGGKFRNIDDCKFTNMGRLAFTCERPRPDLTSNAVSAQTNNVKFTNFLIDNGFNQDGAVALAGIDFETWSASNDVTIDNGILKGSSKISVGSAPNVPLQICRNVKITNLDFDLTGSTNPHDSDNMISVTSNYSNSTLGLASCVRIYEGLLIENIKVYSDKKLGGNVILINNAVFRSPTIRNIYNYAKDTTVNVISCIQNSGAWFEGDCLIEGIHTGQANQGIYMSAWVDPTPFGYAPQPMHLMIRNVFGVDTARGIRGIAPTLPASADGSTITYDNVRFIGQISGTNLDASAFASTGGRAVVLDNCYFTGGGNTFLGFSTPGIGSDTITAGTTSKIVTHNLGYTPTNITITTVGSKAPATDLWTTAKTATTFTVNLNAAPILAVPFDWRAIGPNGLG